MCACKIEASIVNQVPPWSSNANMNEVNILWVNGVKVYSRGAYSQSRPHWQFICYRNFDNAGIEFPIRMGSNFDLVGTNSAMTLVSVLSAKVRSNERLGILL